LREETSTSKELAPMQSAQTNTIGKKWRIRAHMYKAAMQNIKINAGFDDLRKKKRSKREPRRRLLFFHKFCSASVLRKGRAQEARIKLSPIMEMIGIAAVSKILDRSSRPSRICLCQDPNEYACVKIQSRKCNRISTESQWFIIVVIRFEPGFSEWFLIKTNSVSKFCVWFIFENEIDLGR
jgi:hypothetical protein